MGRLRNFLYRKRMMAKGLTVVFAVAAFTIITLASCTGVTKPCVTCKRDPASDPFDSAEEVRWEDLEEIKGEKSRKERRSGTSRADL